MSIIEITGIPGSGKSTFFKKYTRALKEENITYIDGGSIKCSKYYIVKANTAFFFLRPKLFFLFVIMTALRIRHGKTKDIWVTMYRIARTVAQHTMADKQFPDTKVIFDEGLIHRVYTLCIFHPYIFKIKYVKWYLDGIIKPYTLIVLKEKESVAIDRITKRYLPVRWKKLNKTEIQNYMHYSKVINDYILQNIKQLAKVNSMIDSDVSY